VLAAIVLAGNVVAADPPVSWRRDPALLEWSTWVRVGWGVTTEADPPAARVVTPQQPDITTRWELGLGADVSLPLTHAVRLGAFGEARGLEPFAGGELVVTRAPADLDMFWYRGEGVWIVRAGGGRERATASLSWGYRCPWKLWGPYSTASRYEIGARIVFDMTRAYDGHDWSATLGIEFEPIGAIRYVLGIQSWY
jgi:hypothetical protein